MGLKQATGYAGGHDSKFRGQANIDLDEAITTGAGYGQGVKTIKYSPSSKRLYDASTGWFISEKAVWPGNEGFVNSPNTGVVTPGTLLDRYGSEKGRYLSPIGTPYEQRGIPEGYKEYHIYEVVEPFEVKEGMASGVPWFNSSRGGYQYKTFERVEDLLARGKIKQIYP